MTSVLQVKDRDSYPFVLLGNKCDLEPERMVSREEGDEVIIVSFLSGRRYYAADFFSLLSVVVRQLAKEFDSAFLECSAKTRVNIEGACSHLCLAVRQCCETSFRRGFL